MLLNSVSDCALKVYPLDVPILIPELSQNPGHLAIQHAFTIIKLGTYCLEYEEVIMMIDITSA